MNKKKLVIIDGNALLHRAWHAIPSLSTKDGIMVNAVYGWLMIFLKMYKDLRPEYIAVTFDVAGGTFRDVLYEEYKAQREKQPDELYNQIPILKDFLSAFSIKVFEMKGFEADDLIGTICRHNEVDHDDLLTVVLTGDMDTLQLVNNSTYVYAPKKGISETIIYNIDEVTKKYDGLIPDQLIDYKALRGDTSDNVPGIKGIGEKTAIDLIKKFGSLNSLYEILEKDENSFLENGIKKRIIELLKQQKESAFLSKKLVTIKTDVPIDFSLNDCFVKPFDRESIINLFRKFGFRSLIEKLPKVDGEKIPLKNEQGSLFKKVGVLKNKIPYQEGYVLVDTKKKLEEALVYLKKYSYISFDTETDGIDSLSCKLLGVSLCGEAGRAWYISYDLIDWIKCILENKQIKKCAHNAKFDIAVLARYGCNVSPITFDTMIASYLINPENRAHGLDAVVFSYLGHEMIPIEALIGVKGASQITMDMVPIEDVSQYSCEDVDYTFRLMDVLRKELEEKYSLDLFEKIEMPLIEVLYEMEKNGCLIDINFLKNFSEVLKKDLDKIDKTIYEYAGRDFNINSPTQLKNILFNELNIPTDSLKKTKTGISTSAGELDKLRGLHPIIDLITQHRELSKLLSTYVETLPNAVDKFGRVHTSFNQTVAATGRLSSSNPNLQNIPIRTQLGAEIRKSFIAPDGFNIVSADYSQIELRVIASLSGDKSMIRGFNEGVDIHRRTASLIYEIDEDAVTKEQRYAAKAINFGVIYGLGAFGLSKNTGISYEEAKSFIKKYFVVYQGVKEYLDFIKEAAHTNGYVETLFGRRRYFPSINSGVPILRASAERAAINAPVQGTAADLIKMAMITVFNKLSTDFPQVRMILQVHDELVFEVPVNLCGNFIPWVKNIMEGVHTLAVPIVVDVELGKNWGELS